jgi:glycosyltransferase involved in cell wall biosynthesis
MTPNDKGAKMPRISVILTVYKRTDYLGIALDSALAQVYPDYEILVADDSGTEAARPIVEARSQSPRIRYLPNATTLGVAGSLAGAIGKARGEWIAILNDDDVWEPTLLAELAAPMAADARRVLAFSDHWIIDSDGKVDQSMSELWSKAFGRLDEPEGDLVAPADFSVIRHGVPIAQSALFRKDAVGPGSFPAEISGAYDFWLSCLLAATGCPIYYVSKRLARWRVYGAMETRRLNPERGRNLVYILSRVRTERWFPNLGAAVSLQLVDAWVALGRDQQSAGHLRAARICYWQGFLAGWQPALLATVVGAYLPYKLRSFLRSLLPSSGRRSPPQADAPVPDPIGEMRSSLGHGTAARDTRR